MERGPKQQEQYDKVSRAIDELLAEGKIERITDADGAERFMNTDPASDGDATVLVSDRVHGLTHAPSPFTTPRVGEVPADPMQDEVLVGRAVSELIDEGLIRERHAETLGPDSLRNMVRERVHGITHPIPAGAVGMMTDGLHRHNALRRVL
jgi:hypothetical protein